MESGLTEPLPDYVDDIMLARYIGITVSELHRMPTYELDQYRAVRAAEYKAQDMRKQVGR